MPTSGPFSTARGPQAFRGSGRAAAPGRPPSAAVHPASASGRTGVAPRQSGDHSLEIDADGFDAPGASAREARPRGSAARGLRRLLFSAHRIDRPTYEQLLQSRFPAGVTSALAGRSLTLEQAASILSNPSWARLGVGHGRTLVGAILRHVAAPNSKLDVLVDVVPPEWSEMAREELASLPGLGERRRLAQPEAKALCDAYREEEANTGKVPGMAFLREALASRGGPALNTLQLLDLIAIANRGLTLELTQRLWPFWSGEDSPAPLLRAAAWDERDGQTALFSQHATDAERAELTRSEHRARIAHIFDPRRSIAAASDAIIETFGPASSTAMQLYEAISFSLPTERLDLLDRLWPSWSGEGRPELLLGLFPPDQRARAADIMCLTDAPHPSGAKSPS